MVSLMRTRSDATLLQYVAGVTDESNKWNLLSHLVARVHVRSASSSRALLAISPPHSRTRAASRLSLLLILCCPSLFCDASLSEQLTLNAKELILQRTSFVLCLGCDQNF